MAARSRITVLLLLFLLSTEHSFAVTQNKLTPLVEELLSKYSVEGMFSLAVSIPLNQNQNKNQNKNQDQNAFQIIKEVNRSDPAYRVKEKINKGEVYVGERMIAAKVLMRENGPGADHAESRVVDNLCNSLQVNKEDLLLLYVYASPCVEKCTNKSHPQNILGKINNIRRWKSYAVVFSKIFRPRNSQEKTDKKSIEARREALNQLATYQGKLGPIGLENIFRCDRKKTETNKKQTMQCVSCSNKGQVVDECVSDDAHSANVNSGRGRRSNKRRVKRDISYNTGDSSSHISESNKGAEDAPSVDENGNDMTGEAASSSTGESASLSPTGSDDGNGSDLSMAEDVSSPQIGFDSGDGNGKVSRGKGKVSKGKGGKRRRGKGKGIRGQGGKGKVSRGKGKVSKGKGGKGRRGKGKVSKGKGGKGRRGKGKGIRGQGGKGKGRRVKGKGKGRRGKGGKGKGRRGKGKGRRGKGGKGKGSRRGGRSRRRGLDQEWIFVKDF